MAPREASAQFRSRTHVGLGVRKTFVCLTGLLGDSVGIERYDKYLWELLSEKTVDGVILSTWASQSSALAQFSSILGRSDVTVLLHPDPDYRVPGNIWAQSLSLDLALSQVTEDDVVLKTRVDVGFGLSSLRHLARPESWCSSGPPHCDQKIGVHDEAFCADKLWVPWVETYKPLYIADEAIAGTRRTLQSTVHYDAEIRTRYAIDTAATHITRYAPMALAHDETFHAYLEWFGRTYHATPSFLPILQTRMRDPIFAKVLRHYYLFLLAHFQVDSSPGGEEIYFRKWLPPKKPLLPQNYCPCDYSSDYSWGLDRVYANNSVWIERAAREPSTLSHRSGCALGASTDEQYTLEVLRGLAEKSWVVENEIHAKCPPPFDETHRGRALKKARAIISRFLRRR